MLDLSLWVGVSACQVSSWDPESGKGALRSCSGPHPPKGLNWSLCFDTRTVSPSTECEENFRYTFNSRGGQADYKEVYLVSSVRALMPPTYFKDNGPQFSSLVASGNENWNFILPNPVVRHLGVRNSRNVGVESGDLL